VSLVQPTASPAIDLHGGALLALIDLAASTDPAEGRSLHALVGAALDAIGAEAAIVVDEDAVVLAVPKRIDRGELVRAARLAVQAGGQAGRVTTVRLSERSNRLLAIRWREDGSRRHDLLAAVDGLCAPVAEPALAAAAARADGLTGLPDRVATLEHLDEALHRARRAGRPVGVLYIDLDGFKGVTTPSATPTATARSPARRARCARRCGAATWWAGSAATSSWP
jgi:GGDEF domain-containing protein